MRPAQLQPDHAGRRSIRWGVAIGVSLAAFATASVAFASFSTPATGGGGNLTTKRIFPGVRSAWPWDIRDQSGGVSEANASDPLSFADAVVQTTGNWSNAFSTTRFDDFDYGAGRAAGIPVTSATFSFTFAPSQSTANACFYVEVRRASTNALLGTHGSSGTPSACTTGGAQLAATVDVSAEVTTTDIANDLRIRVYADSTKSKAITIELATVSVTTPYATATIFATRWDDESTGAPAVTLWPLVAADGTVYTSASAFLVTFSPTHYIKFTPNEAIPAGSTITSAQVQFGYKSATAGNTACWYFEVYNGATLIGTHGSSTTPVSCNSTSASVTPCP